MYVHMSTNEYAVYTHSYAHAHPHSIAVVAACKHLGRGMCIDMHIDMCVERFVKRCVST